MGVAFIFPGQAAQFVGMGSVLLSSDKKTRALMELTDHLLGYSLSEIMLNGPEEKLTETIFTQPAVYVHSMMVYYNKKKDQSVQAVAGHSLGEISACVAAGVFSYEDGLKLVQQRAEAMQKACEINIGTMAAVLGMEDELVEEICQKIEGVVPANYNCPGQLVISGTKSGIEKAILTCKENGAKRALEIAVGGAFHSPLMQPALETFRLAINDVPMNDAAFPVYQNVDASPHSNAEEIRANLISQVINPVQWTSSINHMIRDGILEFIEVGGKGRILQGMLRKISREIQVEQWQEE